MIRNITTHWLNTGTPIVRSTKREVADMLNGGMQEVRKETLDRMLADLNYSIQETDSFCYTNNGNSRPYLARSIHIIDNKTGLSFSHVDADRTNLEALQEIRRDYFVFHSTYIWEL